MRPAIGHKGKRGQLRGQLRRVRNESLRMEVGVTEGQVDGGESLEMMADHQLIRHAHAAVQLHGLLTNEACRLTDDDLRRGEGAAAFGLPSDSAHLIAAR